MQPSQVSRYQVGPTLTMPHYSNLHIESWSSDLGKGIVLHAGLRQAELYVLTLALNRPLAPAQQDSMSGRDRVPRLSADNVAVGS